MRKLLPILVLLLGITPCLADETYPTRPVKVVVPVAAGGTTDLFARLISTRLSEQLKQGFVVENRTGAGGRIAAEFVAKSAPDGYTLLLAEPGFTIAAGMFQSMPYDVIKDFAPITQIAGIPLVLVVTPSLNVTTLKQFVALAQANPGKFNFGSGGAGSAQHLAMELFKRAANVNVTHVPYRGAGEALTAMLGGSVHMMISGIATVTGPVGNGTLRALAVTTDGKRSSTLPNVPSMDEAGLQNMAIYAWFGLVGPARMPSDAINRLHAEVVKAIEAPAVRGRVLEQGGEVVGSSPKNFQALISNELQRWSTAIKAAGITPGN